MVTRGSLAVTSRLRTFPDLLFTGAATYSRGRQYAAEASGQDLRPDG